MNNISQCRILELPNGTSEAIGQFIKKTFDNKLVEAERLLTAKPVDSLQSYLGVPPENFGFSLTLLLLSLIDGAAHLLTPNNLRDNGDIFCNFIDKNFPWDVNYQTQYKCLNEKRLPRIQEKLPRILWKFFRNPIVHSLGVRNKISNQWQFKIIFPPPHFDETKLEELKKQDLNFPFEMEEKKIIRIIIPQLYLSILNAIQKTLNDPSKIEAIQNYILSGEWDYHKKRAKKTS